MKQATATVVIYGITDFDKDGVEDVVRFTFTYPECHFEFRVSDIESESPSACYLKIPGISKQTYSLFEDKRFAKYGKNQIVEIYFGYDREEELVYRGVVSRVRYHFDFGAQWMELLLDKNMKKFKTQKHSICIQRQSNIFEALSIICDAYGYTFECPDAQDLKSIQIAPTTFEGNMEDCLKTVIGNKMSYYVDMDKIVVYSKTKSINVSYILLFSNGLIAYPVLDTNKLEDGEIYSIKHRIMPGIKVGSILKMPVDKNGDYSENDTNSYEEYIVREYVTNFSSSQMITEMECEKRNG